MNASFEADVLLYHYTSLAAFTSIVSTGKLWATHIQYLNDTSEQRLVLEAAIEDIKRRLGTERSEAQEKLLFWQENLLSWSDWGDDEETTYYVICFSEDGGDRLSQWRGYGGQGGLSIGFQRSALQSLCGRAIEGGGRDGSLQKVWYLDPTGGSDGSVFVDALLQLDIRNGQSRPNWERTVRNMMSFIGAHYKHAAFEEERETRVLLDGRSKVKCNRLQGTLLIPYVELEIGPVFANLIKQITIGPSPNQKLTGRAIKNLLLKRGWDSIHVYPSGIPYRGF